MFLKEVFEADKYEEMKKRIYACEAQLQMPFYLRFIAHGLRFMERFWMFRQIIALRFRIRPWYAERIAAYRKGILTTNEARSGEVGVAHP